MNIVNFIQEIKHKKGSQLPHAWLRKGRDFVNLVFSVLQDNLVGETKPGAGFEHTLDGC